MKPTLVDVRPRGDALTCRLDGDLILPRLVTRRGTRASIALVAGRALLLPGDDVALHISVGAGCDVALMDVGGLVVYGHREGTGEQSHWRAEITLEAGATLRWNALPTVVADGANLRRTTRVRLDTNASATLRETLVFGRSGEWGGTVDVETDVADAAGPILRERLKARGSDGTPGHLGGARVFDTIVAIGDRPAPAEDLSATRLALERAGGLLRWMGTDAHASPLADAWRLDEKRSAAPTTDVAQVAAQLPTGTPRAAAVTGG